MLEPILDVLIRAMLRGAQQVLAVRHSGEIDASYKDATELVTVADKRSDAAIRAVFETELRAIDPTIAFRLEESGATGEQGRHWVGADPLDGTNHFASGGASYSVQSHYIVDGLPRIGVVFQPEVYLPLAETQNCVGRIAYAIHGEGAYCERTDFVGGAFVRSEARPLKMRRSPPTRNFVSCVPLSTKMSIEEWDRAKKVLESGLVSSTTGVGGAGGNAMLALFGGQHVYANLGAGEELDLAPPQVIAEEAGMTVWGVDRQSPLWNVRKQACVFAPSPEIAERFLAAAGL